jgi:hypothetical protein
MTALRITLMLAALAVVLVAFATEAGEMKAGENIVVRFENVSSAGSDATESAGRAAGRAARWQADWGKPLAAPGEE